MGYLLNGIELATLPLYWLGCYATNIFHCRDCQRCWVRTCLDWHGICHLCRKEESCEG